MLIYKYPIKAQSKLYFALCSDAGYYECQVSTTPPIGQQVKLSVVGEFILEMRSLTSFIISLLLLDPEVTVLGGPDLFINAGSFINLTCTGHNLPGIPEDVFWYHESQVRAFNKVQNNTRKLLKKKEK